MSYSKVSKDEFLGGLLTLKQPIKGYRITSDSIFLAASISVKKGEKIYWLTQDFLDYKNILKVHGKQFRYILPLNKKSRKLLKKSKVN